MLNTPRILYSHVRNSRGERGVDEVSKNHKRSLAHLLLPACRSFFTRPFSRAIRNSPPLPYPNGQAKVERTALHKNGLPGIRIVWHHNQQQAPL